MAGQYLGRGGKLFVGDANTPENFLAIGNVIDYNGPQLNSPEIEVTNMDSTEKEYLSDLRDPGTATFNLHHNPADAQQVGLFDDQLAGTTKYYKHQLGTNAEPNMIYAAFVQNLPFSAAYNTPVQIALTLRISGSITATWA